MSGKGKGGRGKGKTGAGGKGTSKAAKAGLQFPVARLNRFLRLRRAVVAEPRDEEPEVVHHADDLRGGV